MRSFILQVMRIDGQVGGYPIKFLEQIVRLSKSLKQKREKIGQLRDLNSQAERRKSFGEYITEDFQRRYASTIIDLSNINRDLKEHIKNIQDFTQEVGALLWFGIVPLVVGLTMEMGSIAVHTGGKAHHLTAQHHQGRLPRGRLRPGEQEQLCRRVQRRQPESVVPDILPHFAHVAHQAIV